LNDEALVRAVMDDLDTAPVSDAEKALLRFVDQMNHASAGIEAADLERLRAHGWTDEQLYYAITVCALFNFYNRWVDATGVQAMSDEGHRVGAARSARHGYVRE